MDLQDDRQLLELAAKAAKRTFHWDGDVLVLDDPQPHECSAWNPLTDDGDALRLAVKLAIAVTPHPIYRHPKHSVEASRKPLDYAQGEVIELYGDDPCAATRRAIVRAAAAIGKSL